MSEHLPPPEAEGFPRLDRDPRWVRELPAGTAIARIFRAGGVYPSDWYEFRTFGPLDGRFDPHPEPVGEHDDAGVMYGVLESAAVTSVVDPAAGSADDPRAGSETDPGAAPDRGASALGDSAFAAALLEVFQAHRMIRVGAAAPTFAVFETVRPLRLLDLSDSDWVAAAGGNAAISSGERAASRAWARAIADRYPELDGVVSASSVMPSARIVALWLRAQDALPRHPAALIRLDRPELVAVIDRIADRYGYLVL